MADSRQFTDHNQVGGVNVFLEDKRLAERTAVGSAAGIANLKFLLANDDTEGFNTAIKAYIDEAVRSAIGTLVDNLDKNTAISRILATDANHDLGTITPANLANVLGVSELKDYGYIGTEQRFNELIAHTEEPRNVIRIRTFYYNGFSYFIIEHYANCLQFKISYYGGQIEVRSYDSSNETFTAWKTL